MSASLKREDGHVRWLTFLAVRRALIKPHPRQGLLKEKHATKQCWRRALGLFIGASSWSSPIQRCNNGVMRLGYCQNIRLHDIMFTLLLRVSCVPCFVNKYCRILPIIQLADRACECARACSVSWVGSSSVHGRIARCLEHVRVWYLTLSRTCSDVVSHAVSSMFGCGISRCLEHVRVWYLTLSRTCSGVVSHAVSNMFGCGIARCLEHVRVWYRTLSRTCSGVVSHAVSNM